MRIACIDIGSNTTRLLVAERDAGGLREVAAERVFTRLGRLGGAIPAEKVAEIAATVAAQVRQAREAGAVEVRAVATAAIRAAANRDEVCAGIAGVAGVPVTLLSGEDEARLAFLGATSGVAALPDGSVAVVDVGGGSTEVVLGTPGEGVTWAASLRAGSGSLTDQHVHGDPPGREELRAIRAHAAGLFAGHDAPAAAPVAAYAVGGSATSLRRLAGDLLDHGTLTAAIGEICAAPAAVVAERLDLHVERVRVLPAGMLLLDAASAYLGVPLEIVCGGLREGVVLDCLSGPTSARP